MRAIDVAANLSLHHRQRCWLLPVLLQADVLLIMRVARDLTLDPKVLVETKFETVRLLVNSACLH